MLKRAIFAGLVALLGTYSVSAQAASGEGAYCAVAGGYNAYSNCGYYTFQQCLAAVNAVGGNCQINPRAAQIGRYDEEEAPPRRKRRARRY